MLCEFAKAAASVATFAVLTTRPALASGQSPPTRTTAPVWSGWAYDFSFLAGIHRRTNSHLDFVAGIGPGVGRGHGTAGENLSAEAVIATGAQLNLNYRVAGIALDGFAAAGPSRWYYGAGFALAFGWFH